MLVQAVVLAVDVVQVVHLHKPGFRVEDGGVAAAVRHVAVGVGVSCAPVQLVVVAQGVLARQLSVVRGAALVIVLRAVERVALRVDALAPGVARASQLVEQVVELEAVVAVGR